MKIIEGFEGEYLEVSDFGEWVGKDYIDYKFEYKNNQKIMKVLFKENQKYKEVIDKVLNIIDECKLLMPHEFDWEDQIDNIEKLLKEVE